jgi:hypothetical protein
MSYPLRNDVIPEDEMFYLVSAKYANFNKYFSLAATMSRQKWIEQNNLGNQYIIAIADKANNTIEKIIIESINRQGNILHVAYTITKKPDKPTGSTSRQNAVVVAAA